MLFIAWGWSDSFRNASSLSIRDPAAHDGVYLSNLNGLLSLDRYTDLPVPLPMPSPAPGKFRINRQPSSAEGNIKVSLAPPPLFARGGGYDLYGFAPPPPGTIDGAKTHHELQRRLMELRPKNDWRLMIPHWLLLLGVVLPWIGLLAWRVKRRSKVVRSVP